MIYRLNILDEEMKRDLPQFASKQSVELHKRRDEIRKKVRRASIARENAEVAKDHVYDRGYNPAEPRDWHGRWTAIEEYKAALEAAKERERQKALTATRRNEDDWKENFLNEEDVPYDEEEDIRNTIDGDFQNMKDYEVVGEMDSRYNCIAWAFGFEDRWWNPCAARGAKNVDKALEAYHTKITESPKEHGPYHDKAFINLINNPPKPRTVKLALFESAYGEFEHMTRQLPDGRWTSKFGGNGKTVQKDLTQMEQEFGGYGHISRIYEMPIKEFSRFRKEHKDRKDSNDWL